MTPPQPPPPAGFEAWHRSQCVPCHGRTDDICSDGDLQRAAFSAGLQQGAEPVADLIARLAQAAQDRDLAHALLHRLPDGRELTLTELAQEFAQCQEAVKEIREVWPTLQFRYDEDGAVKNAERLIQALLDAALSAIGGTHA